MALIREVKAKQILNSYGMPTVEVQVTLDKGEKFRASCPSGTSRGSKEALELTDKNFSRFMGKEVSTAVRKVNEIIAPAIRGVNPIEQGMIDRKIADIDSTPNKANLGVNAILSTSMAVAKAGAHVARNHLFDHLNRYFNEIVVEGEDFIVRTTDFQSSIPRPMFNLINGGQHAHTPLSFQEFLFIPRYETPKNVWEALRHGTEIFRYLERILLKGNHHTGYGEEGGFAPHLKDSHQALDLILEAASKADMKPEKDFGLGLDVAGAKPNLPHADLVEFFCQLTEKYPLETIEDPFPENNWDPWVQFMEKKADKVIIIGDDLTATNPEILLDALKFNAINGIIIKPNQIGTVTETLRVAKIAKSQKIKIVVSHRSKETNDDFITDLAVAIGADYLKAGAPNRGERIAKYNRLLTLSEIIG